MKRITPDMLIGDLIDLAIKEDIGDGDHTSMACIPEHAKGSARLLVKEDCIIAGMAIAREIFRKFDQSSNFTEYYKDGSTIKAGDLAFVVYASVLTILKAERLVLNIMQRMSGIATLTSKYAEAIKGTATKILDTRKTSPGMRWFEKEAVRIGGGYNHRFGLYDMILLKDNHIDFAGGIENAIGLTKKYLSLNRKDLRIEIEARTLQDVEEILKIGGVDRIMLDNFSTEDTIAAVKLIGKRFETESSGNITLENIRNYAACGVDYISVGALTHHIKSIDLSLKAII